MDELKYIDGSFIINDNNINDVITTIAAGSNNKSYETVDNPEYIEAYVDSSDNVLLGVTIDGGAYFSKLYSPTLDDIISQIPPSSNFVTATDIEDVSNRIKTPNIWLPNYIYCLDGALIQIFKSSMIAAHNPDNYELRINRYDMPSADVDYGANYDTLYEYLPNLSNPDFNLRFGFYNDITGLTWADNDTSFVHVSKKESPTTVKNVLCIGDSFTDADVWESELRRLLTGEVTAGYSDSADSSIIADSLTNINFIGTRNTSQTPNEGWSGKHYKFFATDVSSPFLNTDGVVDFDYYIATQSVKGTVADMQAGDLIDSAIIILGTNSNYEEEYVRAVWDALLTHNPQIKVLICGRCNAAPYGLPTNIYHNHTYVSLSLATKACNLYFQNLCSLDEYKDNFLYVDYGMFIDSFHNMGHNYVYANQRNINEYDKIFRGTDNVHPATIGYWQIADALRPAFHYWCL